MEDSNREDESMMATRPRGTRIPARLPFVEPDSPVSRTSAPSLSSNGQGTSFTEAFSFLRNTEFYSPPPAKPPPPLQPACSPPPKPATAPTSSGAPTSTTTISHQEQEVNLAALSGQARNQILVSRRQQGNPILKHIRNVRWMFTDIIPDYIVGQTSCALYLSLRYHLLHPDYIYYRIRELTKGFRLRVVLCHVDVDDVIKPLHEVTKTCLLHDCSLLCAWSQEECARYLETIKSYENKPADQIQERTDNDYLSRLTNALTTVRHVNKTNVVSLGAAFGTLGGVFQASMDDLARCPGIGERKVKRLYDAFHEPFRRLPPVKVKEERTDSGDVTPSQMSRAQTEVAGASGNGGDQTVEGNENFGQESLAASKLISREGDVSIREALNAARRMLKETPSPNKKDEVSPSKNNKASPIRKEKTSPSKRRRVTDMAAQPQEVDVADISAPSEEIVGQFGSTSSQLSVGKVGYSDVKSHSVPKDTMDQVPENLGEDYVISLDDD